MKPLSVVQSSFCTIPLETLAVFLDIAGQPVVAASASLVDVGQPVVAASASLVDVDFVQLVAVFVVPFVAAVAALAKFEAVVVAAGPVIEAVLGVAVMIEYFVLVVETTEQFERLSFDAETLALTAPDSTAPDSTGITDLTGIVEPRLSVATDAAVKVVIVPYSVYAVGPRVLWCTVTASYP